MELFGTKAKYALQQQIHFEANRYLRCFNVTLIQIDISIWYKVAFFTVLAHEWPLSTRAAYKEQNIPSAIEPCKLYLPKIL